MSRYPLAIFRSATACTAAVVFTIGGATIALADDETPTPSPTATASPKPTTTPEVTPTANDEVITAGTSDETSVATDEPTAKPTSEPSASATTEATDDATAEPSVTVTDEPTNDPTAEPSDGATASASEDPGASDADKLEFAPPKLTSPTTVPVPASGKVSLSKPGDYVVKLPEDAAFKGQVTIDGKNKAGSIQVIGGAIDNTGGHGAMVIKGITGSIYLEGVKVGNGTGDEGLDLDNRKQKPGSKVMLQNVEFGKVAGSRSGNHADLVQIYGGSKGSQLVLARVKGESNYQGVMFQPEKFGDAISKFVVHDTVLKHTGNSGYGGVFLTGAGKKVARDWKDFTVVDGSGKPQVYPNSTINSEDGTKVTDSAKSPLIGKPGTDYTSPGYAQQ